jgi:choline dehydrogenase-like flavoprotein
MVGLVSLVNQCLITYMVPNAKLLDIDNETGMNAKRMFNITSQPNPVLNNKTFLVGIGSVVGGSSSINGQVFLRGSKADYDAWNELGGSGAAWGWDDLLPYFRKVPFRSVYWLHTSGY